MLNLLFTLFANTSYHHSPIKLDGPFDGLSDRLKCEYYMRAPELLVMWICLHHFLLRKL